MKRFAAAVVLLVACRSAAAPPAPAPPAAPRRPAAVSQPGRPAAAAKASPSPRALRWVQRSAEFRALSLQTYRLAADHVERAAQTRAAGTWGIVTDADETAISNVGYEVQLMARAGEEAAFDEALWTQWVKAREAPPLPGAVEFLRRVRRLGGRIAVVTNRALPDCPATEEDLKKYGLEYDVILCGSGDKNPRFESVRSGAAFGLGTPVEVVAYLGDNIRDFPLGTQDWRKQPDTAFAEFGGRFFAFPNPMYGSFLSNPD
jgi:5'-nucleotidase (lipoprotein e(P4) family)